MTPHNVAGPAPPDLLELGRSGQLAARYPLVRQHLTDLGPQELGRVGHTLARLDLDEVLRHHPATPTVTVALTGHGTVSSLVPPLTAELARHGLLARPVVGDFDGYVLDLGDPGSRLYSADPDLTLCVLDPMVVFDEVGTPWTAADVEKALIAKIGLLERLVTIFGERDRGTLVLNTLPLPRRFTAQLVDYRSRAVVGAAWREANAKLLRLMHDHPRLVVIDLDPLVAEGGPANDARQSVYAKAHLSSDLQARYAREVGHLARATTGRTRKCLVVDLDGTLWGGVLGDDGVEGIEVAGGYRGEAFRAFQRVVKQIGSQGVLLAAVSKNQPDLVRRAFRERTDMTVTEDDLLQILASWRPKPESLTELAATLNLGLDSVVFVDDSAYERELVRRELPEVTVLAVDDEPAGHVEKLLADGWFDTRELTAADLGRGRGYRAELARRSFLDTFDSIEDFLRQLHVTVRLGVVRPADIPRVSQLTLRTNQFNLTVDRLGPPEVERLVDEPGSHVLTIRAADRFGDSGLVGAVFLRRDGAVARIDNFVLSCRVFSRGIERGCLSAILEHARDAGAEAVDGVYRAGPRNGVVKDFYPRHGFTPVGEDGAGALFRHDLRDIPTRPDHVELVADFGGTGS